MSTKELSTLPLKPHALKRQCSHVARVHKRLRKWNGDKRLHGDKSCMISLEFQAKMKAAFAFITERLDVFAPVDGLVLQSDKFFKDLGQHLQGFAVANYQHIRHYVPATDTKPAEVLTRTKFAFYCSDDIRRTGVTRTADGRNVVDHEITVTWGDIRDIDDDDKKDTKDTKGSSNLLGFAWNLSKAFIDAGLSVWWDGTSTGFIRVSLPKEDVKKETKETNKSV